MSSNNLCSIANDCIRQRDLQPGAILCVVAEVERPVSRRSEEINVVTRRAWYVVSPKQQATAYRGALPDYDNVVFVDRRSRHELERLPSDDARNEWAKMNPVEPNKKYMLSHIAHLQRCPTCNSDKLEVRLKMGTPFVFCQREQSLRRVQRP